MSRIKGRRPSASIIVAVVALVAALGSSAVAGVTISKLNNKEKKQVKRLSKKQAKKLDRKIELLPGPKGPKGEPATSLFAFVKSDGSLYYGGDVAATQKDRLASYTVTFNRNVADCAVLANAGGHEREEFESSVNSGSTATVRNNNDNSVEVGFENAFDPAGPTDFYVAVFCP
jgi:hypothetical protein